MSFKLSNFSLKGSSEKYYIYGLILLLIFAVVATILLCSVPPISRDALTHHLFVPKLYLQHGGLYEIPEIPFSYYPMNLDLLYMIPLYFGNDIMPKYMHFLFALMTAWLIFNYLKTRFNIINALLGSLFLLTIPIIIKLSITVYVDLGLMFFTTAALLLLFRWLNSGYKYRFLVFSGICCGLAAGIKYNGLINIFLITLFVPLGYIRSRREKTTSNIKAITYSLLFLSVTLITFSPWLVKNYVWTGNPIFPLHDSIFQQATAKITNQEEPAQGKSLEVLKKIASRGNGVFASRKILYHETWWQALLLPVRFFFEGQDDNPRYFDGRLNPFLLILPFFAFIRKCPNTLVQLEKHTLLGFSVLFFFFTFFQESMRIRYIVCIIPPLVLLSVFGFKNIKATISEIQSQWLYRCTVLLGIITLASIFSYNTYYIAQQFQIIQPLSYIRGTVTREQYITRFHPEYEVIKYANENLEGDSRVLCIFLGNRGYYMNFKPIFDMPFKKGLLTEILYSSTRHISIKLAIQQLGIQNILLRDDLFKNWYQSLTESTQEEVSSFFNNDTEQLFSSGGYTIYRILVD